MVSEVRVKRMGVLAIDFNLLKKREGSIEIFFDEFLYVCLASGLLTKKLVAREAHNHQTLMLQIIVKVGELFVVD